MIAPHKKWLIKAEDDLNFANVGIEAGFYAQVCFLSQQVIEKSLKSYLVFSGELYPRTHKLVDLWKLCRSLEKELTPFEGRFRIIDEYYIPARYPDVLPGSLLSGEPSLDNAGEALETATRIYKIINDKIGQK